MLIFNPMSKKELIVFASIVLIIAGSALRGAWAFIQDAMQLLMPFLIFIDTVGR